MRKKSEEMDVPSKVRAFCNDRRIMGGVTDVIAAVNSKGVDRVLLASDLEALCDMAENVSANTVCKNSGTDVQNRRNTSP